MNIRHALTLTVTLQAGLGFIALAWTGKLPLALLVLGGLGLAVSMIRLCIPGLNWGIIGLSRTAWNLVMLVAFAAALADFIWGEQDLLHASMYLLIALMIHKLMTLEHHHDFLYLLLVTFLALLASAVLTVDLWYAAVLMAYLLTAIWALLLRHLDHESHDVATHAGVRRPVETVALSAGFFWVTNMIAVGALCVTIAIFFVMPRLGVGFFQKIDSALIRTSGFSDQVELGGIGAIKQDKSLVMRVQFPDLEGPPLQDVRFRGVAFDRYNGHSWTNTFGRSRMIVRNDDRLFTLSERKPRRKASHMIRQQILMEALDTSVLFGMPFVHQLRGDFLAIQADGMNGLSLPVPMAARFQYTITSGLSEITPDEQAAESFEYPPDINAHFLQLPPQPPRIAELARIVTHRARTPYEAVLAIKHHLVSSYRYSLDVGMENGIHALDDFLFTRKTGYCEHYATAMVVMLRAVGIPSRLVTGFLPGEWNDFGNYYRVRKQDAHAWVEVFFPQTGWVTFDPTPTVGAGEPDAMWRTMASFIDSARMKWDRFVIQYSFRDQMAVARAVRERGERLREGSWDVMQAFREKMHGAKSRLEYVAPTIAGVLTAIIVGLSILAIIVVRVVRRRRRTWIEASPERAIVSMYRQMVGLLEPRGFRKTPGMTPLEFSKQINAAWEDGGRLVVPLTELYCRVRYGQEPFQIEEADRAKELLSHLAAAHHDSKNPR